MKSLNLKKNSKKKSRERSQRVLEQKRKYGEAKNLHKTTNTFTMIAPNFVREQLKIGKHQTIQTKI